MKRNAEFEAFKALEDYASNFSVIRSLSGVGKIASYWHFSLQRFSSLGSSVGNILSIKKESFIIQFDNSYARLPGRFYQRINPIPVRKPELVLFNIALAEELGINLETLDKDKMANIFAGNIILQGSDPIALVYAGHQFGYFVPQLGDGRAVLLGEVIDSNGKRRDLQLKGSGQTRFSRRGDGRAALGPVLREYILSEAMHALGIPTTRSLAVVTTGEPVLRETIFPGAILTRVATSHIRIGTFEYFAARKDTESIRMLADYVIERYYPHLKESANPYEALLQAAIEAQALLVAKWVQVGFIHGVMNTDNTSVIGETIDYGPCAFMDTYDPATVFSSIDYYGRYSYGNQAHIAQWNLERLIDCLIPILRQSSEQATKIRREAIESFQSLFQQYWLDYMCSKIGITKSHPDDLPLIQNLLELMRIHRADYTLSFYYLHTAVNGDNEIPYLKMIFSNSKAFNEWLSTWRNRLHQEKKTALEITRVMRGSNPAFIPRNHRVNQAIAKAEIDNDFTETMRLISILSKPYSDQPHNSEYMLPPTPEEQVFQTFCGT